MRYPTRTSQSLIYDNIINSIPSCRDTISSPPSVTMTRPRHCWAIVEQCIVRLITAAEATVSLSDDTRLLQSDKGIDHLCPVIVYIVLIVRMYLYNNSQPASVSSPYPTQDHPRSLYCIHLRIEYYREFFDSSPPDHNSHNTATQTPTPNPLPPSNRSHVLRFAGILHQLPAPWELPYPGILHQLDGLPIPHRGGDHPPRWLLP